jgi:hypothetical protein
MSTKNNKYTFIITSVIYFKNKPLSYSNSRSIYSPQERINQTILTINSIKKKIPEAKIIFLEGGLSSKISNDLISKIDRYIYMGNIKIVRWLIDSKFKSCGEAIMLLLIKFDILKDSEFILKISGRYFLNDNFNIEIWNKNFTCKVYNNTISTRLYGFSYNYIKKWKWILIKSLPYLFLGYSIEKTMFKFLYKKETNIINTLGVEGFVAPFGKIIKE